MSVEIVDITTVDDQISEMRRSVYSMSANLWHLMIPVMDRLIDGISQTFVSGTTPNVVQIDGRAGSIDVAEPVSDSTSQKSEG